MAGPARWGVAAALVATYAALDRLGRSYGSTHTERRQALPGDDVCPDPQIETTHAVTVHAPPDRVWPWLVQMGWGRGQWYTARWVDRLLFPANGPSAERIEPELQHLEVGDRVLDGPPEAQCAFVVELLEPTRHLVLHSRDHLPPGWAERFEATIDFTWAFVLTDLGDRRTRLVFRSRARLTPRWVTAVYRALLPADFVMSRQMLHGVRSRAERSPSPPHVVLPTAGSGRTPGGRPGHARVDLYWIPLGAGARVVRASGRIYEALAATVQHRSPSPLFHSALVVETAGVRTVVEMAPVPDDRGRRDRGVVAEGPVGSRWLRQLRVFRYEVRSWDGGDLPDLAAAVASPVRITDDAALTEQILELVACVPTPVWGRDEFGHGEMWNSNSVTSWVLTHASLEARAGSPPMQGRAPGWDAGVREARRSAQVADDHRPCPRAEGDPPRRADDPGAGGIHAEGARPVSAAAGKPPFEGPSSLPGRRSWRAL